MMSLDEAIKHAEKMEIEQIRLMCRYDAASGYARSGNEAIRTESSKECEKCAAEHRQLAAWLRELRETRKERDYWQEKAHSYEQTIFKLTDAISKQPEIIFCNECKHWKDSDGVYRRGITAESKCPVNSRQVYEGTFFCGMAKRRSDG